MVANSFAVTEKLYKEQKYSEALESLKSVLREKRKEGKGKFLYTEDEAAFLWNSAQEQFGFKHYEAGAAFSDALFQDTGYIKSHPDQVVQAGLYIAYNGVEPDYTKGFDYFRKAADCVPHPASYAAMKHLGFMYENGHGVEANLNKKIEYYEKAGNGGDPAGCYCAGLHYYNLFKKGDPHDFTNLSQAAHYFEKAAQSGALDYIKPDSPLLRECLTQLHHIHTVLEKRHAEWAQFYSDKLLKNPAAESKAEVLAIESLQTETKHLEEKKDNDNASPLSSKGVNSAQSLVQAGVFKQPFSSQSDTSAGGPGKKLR